jgi:hypothetical protein
MCRPDPREANANADRLQSEKSHAPNASTHAFNPLGHRSSTPSLSALPIADLPVDPVFTPDACRRSRPNTIWLCGDDAILRRMVGSRGTVQRLIRTIVDAIS